MTLTDLKAQIALGEDSRRQFKRVVTNADSLAAEMAAFANSEGGTIYLGVADDGTMPGLSREDVARVNQLIGNAASQHVRSPLTVQTENVGVGEERVVIVLSIPKGQDKPYFDRNGVIWFRSDADTRWVSSKDELLRLFPDWGQFHAEEAPTTAGIDWLDQGAFRKYLRDVYRLAVSPSPEALLGLLQDLNLATTSGVLNLAGVLLFAGRPELIEPQLILKAARYTGNTVGDRECIDRADLAGPLPKIYNGALAFVMRNLRRGREGGDPGTPEIPEAVFKELLANALVHRDYLVKAPVRLAIFDNRIEICSPGPLPADLTVAKMRLGNPRCRNPILASHAAKGLLPYLGAGTGIMRTLQSWPRLEFTDDRANGFFTVVLHRQKIAGWTNRSAQRSPRTAGRVIELMKQNPFVTMDGIGDILALSNNSVLRQIRILKAQGKLKRVGPRIGGHWEVIE